MSPAEVIHHRFLTPELIYGSDSPPLSSPRPAGVRRDTEAPPPRCPSY